MTGYCASAPTSRGSATAGVVVAVVVQTVERHVVSVQGRTYEAARHLRSLTLGVCAVTALFVCLRQLFWRRLDSEP